MRNPLCIDDPCDLCDNHTGDPDSALCPACADDMAWDAEGERQQDARADA